MLSGVFGGTVTPSGGTAKTWHFAPASVAPVDEFDPYTYEFGDDVTTDWFQLYNGSLSQLVFNSPETGAGVCSSTMQWTFGGANSTGSTDSPVTTGYIPTSGLALDTDPTPVYLKDCAVYVDTIADNAYPFQLTDAVHNFTLTINQEIDEKRFANGTQLFDAQALGRGKRTIECALQYAKTADTVGTGSEADAWFSDTSVNRFLRVQFTSTRDADTGVPYSWSFSMPMRYYTRAEGAIGGNTTVILTGHAFYEPTTLAYAFDSTVINTLASADL